MAGAAAAAAGSVNGGRRLGGRSALASRQADKATKLVSSAAIAIAAATVPTSRVAYGQATTTVIVLVNGGCKVGYSYCQVVGLLVIATKLQAVQTAKLVNSWCNNKQVVVDNDNR